MSELCDALSCSGCSACANACPKGCISMTADAEGFLRPRVDTERCVECGLCQKACPLLHPPELPEREPQLWAVVNTDDEDRSRAASGGMFILLARHILDRGGVVFGAAFQPDFSVAHCGADTKADVYRFCGPKYVQSVIGDTYQQAKSLLELGRHVLFSGTPCQIMGLRAFLGRDYPNLLAVDIICHGTPSPSVWKHYLAERITKDDGGQLRRVSFRSKSQSWTRYEVVFQYDEKEYRVHNWEDPYMRGFLKELYLRPSCHQCIAKGTRRVSDITLADLWGAGKLRPELHDDKGTSLVMLHSDKGRALWDAVCDKTHHAPVGAEAIDYNPAAVRSMIPHPNRSVFFQRYSETGDLSGMILELTPDPVKEPLSLYSRVRGKIGRALRRWLNR